MDRRKADFAIRQIIGVMGMLIGFAWEQTFDASEAALSTIMPAPHLSKLGLAVLSVGILIPAWRYYLLPMSEAHGWKFGFVIEDVEEKYGDLQKLKKAHEEECEKKEIEKKEKMAKKSGKSGGEEGGEGHRGGEYARAPE